MLGRGSRDDASSAPRSVLGGMTTFYFTFVYTSPETPLIPIAGIDLDLYFPPEQERCNDAPRWYRHRVHEFIDAYVAQCDTALRRIWGHDPAAPSDAAGLYQRWARSIEI
jgi:hypothetical protein